MARSTTPYSLTVDKNSNIYVLDDAGQIIRKITPGGSVTTLAGSARNRGSADGVGSKARFYGPAGIAVDDLGNTFVAELWNHTILKITFLS